MSAAMTALWILFAAVMRFEPAQAVGELHREGDAAHGAHLPVRQHVDRAAEALHEAREVEVVAGEVELDAGRRIARHQRHPAARHRLEQVGARLAT